MERHLSLVSLAVGVILSAAGCSSTPQHSWKSQLFCSCQHASEAQCGEGCEGKNSGLCPPSAMLNSTIDETCIAEPLILPHTSTQPSCGDLTDDGCCAMTGAGNYREGCDSGSCTGELDGQRYSGLAGGFERGQSNMFLDGLGWITGIPSKIMLFNSKVDSHSVSPETEKALQQYLTANGLHDVKVRINQWDPKGEWKRLVQNKSIHGGWKYTVGALVTARYTMLPGRVFGGDEYNPFTHSIHLYSDRPSLALREGAHARLAADAKYRGLLSASMFLPGSPLWIDTPATWDVVDYSRDTGDRALQRDVYQVLFPAYGSRLGKSMVLFLDVGQGQALEGSLAVVGHAVGRVMAASVSDDPLQMAKSLSGIAKKPEPQQDPVAIEQQNPLPPDDAFAVTFIPVEVIYDTSDHEF